MGIAVEFVAKNWYEDALGELDEEGFNSRRREIVFSVCCAESYLVKWVHREVLPNDRSRWDILTELFPVGIKKGIPERTKWVIKVLRSRELLGSDLPDFGQGEWWEDFLELVGYRDALVHANVSRPRGALIPLNEQPRYKPVDIGKLPPGFAVGIVNEWMKELHKAVGTAPPDWLRETPEQSVRPG